MANYRVVSEKIFTLKQQRKGQIAAAKRMDKSCSWEMGFNTGLRGFFRDFRIDLKKIIKEKHIRRILDVGCGGGFLLYRLARTNSNLELHGTSIKAAPSLWDLYNSKLRNKIKFREGISGIDLSKNFKPNYFDLIISRMGLYHELHLNRAITQARGILAPGKYLLINCAEGDRKLLKLKGFQRVEERRLAGDLGILLFLKRLP